MYQHNHGKYHCRREPSKKPQGDHRGERQQKQIQQSPSLDPGFGRLVGAEGREQSVAGRQIEDTLDMVKSFVPTTCGHPPAGCIDARHGPQGQRRAADVRKS